MYDIEKEGLGHSELGEPMHPRVITKAMPTLTNRDGSELSRVVLLDAVKPPRSPAGEPVRDRAVVEPAGAWMVLGQFPHTPARAGV